MTISLIECLGSKGFIRYNEVSYGDLMWPNDHLGEGIELLLRTPPIMHRKVDKDTFRVALE
jgi:hypothetical protein